MPPWCASIAGRLSPPRSAAASLPSAPTDLVVVLASPSDDGPRGLGALPEKIAAYQVNGACLGWLRKLRPERITPVQHAVGNHSTVNR
jgi:hypothetical protein